MILEEVEEVLVIPVAVVLLIPALLMMVPMFARTANQTIQLAHSHRRHKLASLGTEAPQRGNLDIALIATMCLGFAVHSRRTIPLSNVPAI